MTRACVRIMTDSGSSTITAEDSHEAAWLARDIVRRATAPVRVYVVVAEEVLLACCRRMDGEEVELLACRACGTLATQYQECPLCGIRV